MKKIQSLFCRNYDGDRMVRDEIVAGAEWVLSGIGIPTQKHDGTCCLVRDGKLYRRYEVKPGGTPPPNFEAATDQDPETGKQQGWVPVGDGNEDRWHREAFAGNSELADDTYELCGPKIQGNPEGFQSHVLVRHGSVRLDNVPFGFAELREWLKTHNVEGVVWHHPEDGRMVKIKGKDFGLKR